MTLAPGTKLGPYEILTPIGAGGMGEVYRARDPRVGRDVAIKVSSEQFSDRFTREIHAVAALNHSNVCTLYDVGANYLVMELVEGPTLADRIKQGAIPLDEALEIARQIADALGAAHEKGIVHRDLKPGNIKIRLDGTVKVLDFGLAKVEEAVAVSLETSPTLSVAQTAAGVLLGTAAYMSPEQARGKPVDKRADIWAFGVVLYEMLTGKQLFSGETISDTLAATLREDPDFEKVPAKVRPLLRSCLEKNPSRRLRDIGDAWRMLEGAEELVQGKSSKKWLVVAAAFLLMFAVAGVTTILYVRSISKEQPVRRLTVLPASKSVLNATSAASVSPDGLQLAYLGRDQQGKSILFVRPMDSLDSNALAEVDNWYGAPIWSPDSKQIAFTSSHKLKTVEISGGRTQSLCDIDMMVGGSWGTDGNILYASGINSPILRISAAGGTPEPVTRFDDKLRETGHAWPQFLPDNRHFLYLAFGGSSENWRSRVGSLDSRESAILFQTSNKVAYAQPGYLLFIRDTVLMAQPFDSSKLKLYGDPTPVADGIAMDPFSGSASFSVSESGVLACVTLPRSSNQLRWFDRQGKPQGDVGPPGIYTNPSISPDGKRIAVDRYESTNAQPDIWIINTDRQSDLSRFTFHPGDDSNSLWSPDGEFLVFSSLRGSARDLYLKDVPGAGTEELICRSAEDKYPTGWAPDGKTLLFMNRTNATKPYDTWALPVFGDRKAVQYLQTEFAEWGGQFSPDGQWVAYSSDETGQFEVYVQPYPRKSGKVKISTSGGWQPRWRGDGKEIFYLTVDQKIMAVAVGTERDFAAGDPVTLFQTRLAGAITRNNYDVTRDGQRFLVVSPADETATITVTLNWTSLLKK